VIKDGLCDLFCIKSISLRADTADVVAVSLGVVVRVAVVQVHVPGVSRIIIVLGRRPEVVARIRQIVPLLAYHNPIFALAKYRLFE
jgi:hypothetical protein